MKAVVTGGAGFIGSNIATALLQRGDEVVVLDDLSSGYASNVPDGALFVKGSVLDQGLVEDAVRDAEVVFHHAASVGNKRSIDDPRADASTNVLGTVNVLEACRHAGVRKIVYASSAGIFGELQTLPIDETHPLEPDSPVRREQACGREGVPRLREALRPRGGRAAVLQRLRAEPAFRRLRERHPDLRVPDAAE